MASTLELAIKASHDDSDVIRSSISLKRTRTATSSNDLFASGGGSMQPVIGSVDGRAQNQYSKFEGWTYVAINAIAKRAARQNIKMAASNSPGSKRSMTRFIKSFNSDFSGKQIASRLTDDQRRCLFNKRFTPPILKEYIASDLAMIETHPLLDAIKSPNELMTKWSLLYVTIASLDLTGKAYWWIYQDEDSETGEAKLKIWPIPSSWIKPNHSGGFNSSFKVTPPNSYGKSFDIPGEQIVPFVLPDPSNPTATISPLQTQAKAVHVDESIQTAQAAQMDNGLYPGVMITAGRLPDTPAGLPGERPVLTAAQRKDLIGAIKGVCQGVYNFDEPFIVDGLIESVQPFTLKPTEMAFLESGSVSKSRIFGAYGVNPIIIGEIAGANRAQAAVAEDNFCACVVNPLLELLSEVMTKFIGKSKYLEDIGSGVNIVIWIEPAESHDADLELARWSKAEEAGYITGNEFRTNILNLAPLPGLENLPDKVPVADRAANQVGGKRLPKEGQDPAGSQEEGEEVEEEEEDTGKGTRRIEFKSSRDDSLKSMRSSFTSSSYVTKDQRAEMWLKSQKSSEVTLQSALADLFDEQIEDAAAAFGKSSVDVSIKSNYGDLGYHFAARVMPLDGYKDIISTCRPYLIEAAARGAITEVSAFEMNRKSFAWHTKAKATPGPTVADMSATIPHEMMSDIKEVLTTSMRQKYWKHIQETTRKRLGKVIADGLENGLVQVDIAKNIMAAMSGQVSLDRAKMIARSETTMAMNAGHYQAIQSVAEHSGKNSPIIGIQWWDMEDMDVRRTHSKMHHVTVGLNEWFKVPMVISSKSKSKKKATRSSAGKSASVISGHESAPYPGYYGLSAGNRCHCRCTVVSVTSFDKYFMGIAK